MDRGRPKTKKRRKVKRYSTSPHIHQTNEPIPIDRNIPPKAKRKPKQVTYVRGDSLGKKLPMAIYTTIMLLFVLGLLVTISFSNVTIQRNLNNRLAQELLAAENTNAQLLFQINNLRNLDDVDYIARTRLGMSDPMPYQITLIYVAHPVEIIYDYTIPIEIALTLTERMLDTVHRAIDFFSGGY